MVFIASNSELNYRNPEPQEFLESEIRRDAFENFQQRKILQSLNPSVGKILTDQENGLDLMQKSTTQTHFSIMNQLFPVSFWIWC